MEVDMETKYIILVALFLISAVTNFIAPTKISAGGGWLIAALWVIIASAK
jgi:hypothetical protein